jgi:hypothetical protein
MLPFPPEWLQIFLAENRFPKFRAQLYVMVRDYEYLISSIIGDLAKRDGISWAEHSLLEDMSILKRC